MALFSDDSVLDRATRCVSVANIDKLKFSSHVAGFLRDISLFFPIPFILCPTTSI